MCLKNSEQILHLQHEQFMHLLQINLLVFFKINIPLGKFWIIRICSQYLDLITYTFHFKRYTMLQSNSLRKLNITAL